MSKNCPQEITLRWPGNALLGPLEWGGGMTLKGHTCLGNNKWLPNSHLSLVN